MSAFQEKPGYCVWGMQNEDESNEDKVSRVKQTRACRNLIGHRKDWGFHSE